MDTQSWVLGGGRSEEGSREEDIRWAWCVEDEAELRSELRSDPEPCGDLESFSAIAGFLR